MKKIFFFPTENGEDRLVRTRQGRRKDDELWSVVLYVK